MHLIFANGQLVLRRQDDNLTLPLASDLEGVEYFPSAIAIDEVNLLGWLGSEAAKVNLPAPLELVSLRYALQLFDFAQIEKTIYAQQILYYQTTHRFCGTCGQATGLNPETKRLRCLNCQEEIYPRISPAMIVAITKGDELLMAQTNHFAPEMWSVLAGFCEVGESLEQTVHREVFEEVGLKVKNVRYWGSQYWPFPNSLMVGFTAEYASGEIVLDRTEMRAAGFYRKDQLPGRPSTNLSIASKLIDDFIARN